LVILNGRTDTQIKAAGDATKLSAKLRVRSHPRRSGSLPHEPRIARGARTEHGAPAGIESGAGAGEPVVERFGWRFRMRDKVIQTENDYDKDVFNGDFGTIGHIDPAEHEVTIRFDERSVKYDFGELDEVSLAYAVTTTMTDRRGVTRGCWRV
jgi:ATP-dependent exoDNAse (exonuclease V) alpha subunit